MGRGDLTAARGTPALVSSTLRELLSPQPLTIEFARKTRPRLPASTAPKPRFEEAEDEAPPDLRVELRHSDRALSDLRTELWQAQERARRLASEVWRMDGERSRVRAVQAQLQAEVAGLLQAVRLRPVLHGEHSNAATESASEQERELRETVELLSALRRAVGEGGMLLEVSAVQKERQDAPRMQVLTTAPHLFPTGERGADGATRVGGGARAAHGTHHLAAARGASARDQGRGRSRGGRGGTQCDRSEGGRARERSGGGGGVADAGARARRHPGDDGSGSHARARRGG
jgi:hypothetical protein